MAALVVVSAAPALKSTAAADDEGNQATTGSIQGQVVDSAGASISGAKITVYNPGTSFQATVQTDDSGAFKVFNVPYNDYKVKAEVKGFQPAEQAVDIHSAVPAQVTFTLTVAAVSEQVNVTADQTHTVESDQTSADTDLNTAMVGKLIGGAPAKSGLAEMVKTAPGVVNDDNGRIHVRGSESNIQTVVNGVPITDNMSAIFSTSIDPRTSSQVEVITGGIAAEFGDKLGAVVNLTTKSGLNMPISGSLSGGFGSLETGDMAATFGGHEGKFGWFTSLSGSTTHRYLDAPTIDNFHNVGRTASNLTTFDYNPTPNDFLKVTLMFGGSNFMVPNRLDQEIAGQDQRQQLRSYSESLSWHHLFTPTLLGDLSVFHRTSTAELISNPESTPVVASQNRTLTNYGFQASISYASHGHTLKTGVQYTRTPIDEKFNFYPTDTGAFPSITTVSGTVVPNPVLQFSAGTPFVFNDHATGNEISGFVQDRFSPVKNLTLDLGVRFDHYRLLIDDNAASPRVGIAYFFPKTKTVLRASYNRLFQPPPNENLLLASSIQAAQLSPLSVATGQVSVSPVLSDKENVFEFGLQQQTSKFARLSVSVYNKQIRGFSDKDQFFDTGIVFPVSIFAGRVTGEEVRLDTSEWRGFSGFISYANSRSFGITPIVGGLFLGEAVDPLRSPGFRFPNDHDERNEGQFQVSYTNKRSGWWASFGGRFDSGVPVDVEPGTTLQEFVSRGFDQRFFNQIDFQRGRIKPRAVLNFSTGVDLFRKERVGVQVAMDVQNLTDKLYLYNFESVFSGTHVGPPRMYNGRLTLNFK
jgi:hypothetical protein